MKKTLLMLLWTTTPAVLAAPPAWSPQPSQVIEILFAQDLNLIQASSDDCNTVRSIESVYTGPGKQFLKTFSYYKDDDVMFVKRDVDRMMDRYGVVPLTTWRDSLSLERQYLIRETLGYEYQVNLSERSTDNPYITYTNVCFTVFLTHGPGPAKSPKSTQSPKPTAPKATPKPAPPKGPVKPEDASKGVAYIPLGKIRDMVSRPGAEFQITRERYPDYTITYQGKILSIFSGTTSAYQNYEDGREETEETLRGNPYLQNDMMWFPAADVTRFGCQVKGFTAGKEHLEVLCPNLHPTDYSFEYKIW